MESISWKVSPINANEQSLFGVLVRKGEYQTRGVFLPKNRQLEIQGKCKAQGLDLYSALSLRRQLLTFGLRQRLDQDNKSDRAIYSKSFEDVAIDYLKSQLKNTKIIFTEIDQRELQKKVAKEQFASTLEFGADLEIEMRMIRSQWKLNNSNELTGPCFICRTIISRKKLPSGIIKCLQCKPLDVVELQERNIYFNITPDIILLNPIQINGKLVNWIDCKAFYGSFLVSIDSRCRIAPLNKIPSQIMRYTEAYGPGAIFFLRGFHARLAQEWETKYNCLLLDSTSLDISSFNGCRNHK